MLSLSLFLRDCYIPRRKRKKRNEDETSKDTEENEARGIASFLMLFKPAQVEMGLDIISAGDISSCASGQMPDLLVVQRDAILSVGVPDDFNRCVEMLEMAIEQETEGKVRELLKTSAKDEKWKKEGVEESHPIQANALLNQLLLENMPSPIDNPIPKMLRKLKSFSTADSVGTL
jgi:hypothetical protein